jgi:hypothetical protein
MLRALFAFILSAAPVVADEVCDDLWFSRNHLFDRAGYCFGSPLGQSLFDNTGCTTKNPILSELDKQAIAAIRREEDVNRCKVNTNRRTIDLDLIPNRRAMVSVAARDSLGWGCINYLGAPIPVFNGVSTEAQQLGVIPTNYDIVFFYISPYPSWSFVRFAPTGNGPSKYIGWIKGAPTEAQCGTIAG